MAAGWSFQRRSTAASRAGRADYGISKAETDFVLPLASPEHIVFKPVPYESFARSRDLYQDGRVVVVPLPEDDGRAVGVFVNLLSGKRFFFAPTVRSDRSLARVRTLAGRWPDVTVIVPEDSRAHDRVAQYPEFQR